MTDSFLAMTDSFLKIRKRALADFRRRIYERRLFHLHEMVDLAHILAERYTKELTQSGLLSMDENSAPRRRDPYEIRRDFRKTLSRQLQKAVARFWDGRTTMEMNVRASSVELVGFFNEERPRPIDSPNAPSNDSFDTTYAPYA